MAQNDNLIILLLIKILQRIILTGQNLLTQNDLIRYGEEARNLANQLKPQKADFQKITGTYSKILYHLANMYTKGAKSEFERAKEILNEFRRLIENFAISCDVVKSFNALENLIEVFSNLFFFGEKYTYVSSEVRQKARELVT